MFLDFNTDILADVDRQRSMENQSAGSIPSQRFDLQPEATPLRALLRVFRILQLGARARLAWIRVVVLRVCVHCLPSRWDVFEFRDSSEEGSTQKPSEVSTSTEMIWLLAVLLGASSLGALRSVSPTTFQVNSVDLTSRKEVAVFVGSGHDLDALDFAQQFRARLIVQHEEAKATTTEVE